MAAAAPAFTATFPKGNGKKRQEEGLVLRARKQTFPEITSRLPLISKNYITWPSLASKQLSARHIAVLNRISVSCVKTKETIGTESSSRVCLPHPASWHFCSSEHWVNL